MKTPMQELIAKTKAIIKQEEENYIQSPSDGFYLSIRLNQYYLTLFELMLEKERERLCDAYIKGGDAQHQYIIEGSFPYNTAEDWYNETFKTKER